MGNPQDNAYTMDTKAFVKVLNECANDVMFCKSSRFLDGKVEELLKVVCRSISSVQSAIPDSEILCSFDERDVACEISSNSSLVMSFESYLKRLSFVINSVRLVLVRDRYYFDLLNDIYKDKHLFYYNYTHFLFCRFANDTEKSTLYDSNLDVSVQAERCSSPYIVYKNLIVPFTRSGYAVLKKFF